MLFILELIGSVKWAADCPLTLTLSPNGYIGGEGTSPVFCGWEIFVTRLGDFLQAVYAGEAPFLTARATIRTWCNESLEEYGGQRRERAGRRKVSVVGKPTAAPEIEESRFQVWIDGPERLRIERLREDEGAGPASYLVVNGNAWWGRDRRQQVRVGEVDVTHGRRMAPGGTQIINDLLNRENMLEYLAALDLEFVANEVMTGREAVRFRARRRGDKDGIWPHWLSKCAEEFEFVGDPARGLLLRITEFCEGEVLKVREVLDAEFDLPMDDNLFVGPPEGGQRETESPLKSLNLTLEEAAQRTPFVLLAPPRERKVDHLHVAVIKDEENSGGVAACVFFSIGGQSVILRESEVPSHELDEFEWEEMEHAGQKLLVSDPSEADAECVVALEKLGTHVMITSEMERGALLELAVSLSPVATPASSEGHGDEEKE